MYIHQPMAEVGSAPVGYFSYNGRLKRRLGYAAFRTFFFLVVLRSFLATGKKHPLRVVCVRLEDIQELRVIYKF